MLYEARQQNFDISIPFKSIDTQCERSLGYCARQNFYKDQGNIGYLGI